MSETRENRLPQVEGAAFDRRSLVGAFFRSAVASGWQGCVVAEPAAGIYLVETFDWLGGFSHDQRLVRIEDMLGWAFYDSAEWMVNAYEHGVQRRWERERQDQDGDQ